MTAKPAKSTASMAQTENLHGYAVDDSDPAALAHAVELAFNYRGDVTIARRSTGESIEGYVFDWSAGRGSSDAKLRMIPKDSQQRVSIPVSDISSLRFTGKDTASGKSFESWIRKYAEKKLAGETASIESESLEG